MFMMRATLQCLWSHESAFPTIFRRAMLLAQLVMLMFAISPTAHAQSTFKLLHTFTPNGIDGYDPVGDLVRDSSGNLYGVAATGGILTCPPSTWFTPLHGCGTIFRLSASGSFKVLYSFTGAADGSVPLSGLVRDANGNLFGTTSGGGYSISCGPTGPSACGSVFRLDNSGNLTVLHDFLGSASGDGAEPSGPLTLDGQGNLYGLTYTGGTEFGTIYKVTQAGTETILHNFVRANLAGGLFPNGNIVLDASGNLYGATSEGGSAICRTNTIIGGCGTLFKLDASGNAAVHYNFLWKTGWTPNGFLSQDASGDFYGTTRFLGSCDGAVYKLSGGTKTVLHNFCNRAIGAFPVGMVRDSVGNLYGATMFGGTGGCGSVFKVDAKGKETVLHNFTCGTDGAYPHGGVTLDAKGNLYGTTSGTIFELSLP